MIEEAIELKAHHLEWAKTFQQQAARLNAVLGEYITAVHHVGSTAIPGIKSKPIVDIAVVQSQLRFRDALQAELPLAKEYEALKERVACGKHIDSTEYAAAKSSFIAKVLRQ